MELRCNVGYVLRMPVHASSGYERRRPSPRLCALPILTVILLLASAIGAPLRAAPRIDRVTALPNGEIAVSGSAFGGACATCEVQADYGMGWRYALQVSSWTDTRIVARLPDLNAGLDVQISVHGATGVSMPARARVQRERVPARDLRVPASGAVPGLRVFGLASALKVGDSGEETYDVSAALPRCGERALLFEEARLIFVRERFAHAIIVAAPAAGCSTCGPLRVRWYQEPTGYFELQVHVYHRRIDGICPQRQRY